MTDQLRSGLSADDAALLELGIALGHKQAFGLVAGRCSAAHAETLRRLREQKLYQRCAESWEDFCPRFLHMSRSEADRTIKLLQEFGPQYFELSQFTRVSPETYRAIAPIIRDGVLHYNGEAIELNAGNSHKVAAAVAQMRSTLPKPSPESQRLTAQLNDICHETDVEQRAHKLAQHCFEIVKEFDKIARDQRLGMAGRWYVSRSLARVRDELIRLAADPGLTAEPHLAPTAVIE